MMKVGEKGRREKSWQLRYNKITQCCVFLQTARFELGRKKTPRGLKGKKYKGRGENVWPLIENAFASVFCRVLTSPGTPA